MQQENFVLAIIIRKASGQKGGWGQVRLLQQPVVGQQDNGTVLVSKKTTMKLVTKRAGKTDHESS